MFFVTKSSQRKVISDLNELEQIYLYPNLFNKHLIRYFLFYEIFMVLSARALVTKLESIIVEQ